MDSVDGSGEVWCLVLVLPVLAIGDCKHCKNTFDYFLLYCFINIMY